MASGRLGSAKINPVNAALLYSNTSAVPASVNVQATALSSTTNGNLALAIDPATVSLNQTTVATTIASGSMTQRMNWLDPLSNTRPLRIEFASPTDASNSGDFPISYWDGSAWYKPSTGYYGAQNWQKVDPYFLTNPSAYGKVKASLPMQFRFDGTPGTMRWRYYTDVSTFTGPQFASVQQFADPGVSAYTNSVDVTVDGYGACADPYSDYLISTQGSGFTYVRKGSTGESGGSSSNSLMYQLMSSNAPSGYQHFWYAPRIIGSNGLFVVQPTGFSGSQFVISDPEFAVSLGSLSYATIWNAAATAGWWKFSSGYTNAYVGWFEYNPNDQRYYFEMVDASDRKIYSFTRADLRAQATRGTGSAIALSSTMFTNHGVGPWGAGVYVIRPMRIGASLWWTVTGSNVAYVSEDLKNWVLATTYFPSKNYPANTFIAAQTNGTSFLYAQNATANISKFTSGYTGVSETAVLEYNTSISNYQRTGVLLSPGDKLYAQNYGSVPLSVTAMGFEGE